MDVLRKELNTFYESQKLAYENLDYSLLDECKKRIGSVVDLEHDCCVITDAVHDYCYI